MFAFFTTELPTLALSICQVKEFPSVDKIQKQRAYHKEKKGTFDVKAEYSKVQPKNQVLIKSYAANFNRLLNQALSDSDQNMDFLV